LENNMDKQYAVSNQISYCDIRCHAGVPPSYNPFAAQAAHNKVGHAFIKVVGCGGGGGNAIARMISTGLQVMMG